MLHCCTDAAAAAAVYLFLFCCDSIQPQGLEDVTSVLVCSSVFIFWGALPVVSTPGGHDLAAYSSCLRFGVFVPLIIVIISLFFFVLFSFSYLFLFFLCLPFFLSFNVSGLLACVRCAQGHN